MCRSLRDLCVENSTRKITLRIPADPTQFLRLADHESKEILRAIGNTTKVSEYAGHLVPKGTPIEGLDQRLSHPGLQRSATRLGIPRLDQIFSTPEPQRLCFRIKKIIEDGLGIEGHEETDSISLLYPLADEASTQVSTVFGVWAPRLRAMEKADWVGTPKPDARSSVRRHPHFTSITKDGSCPWCPTRSLHNEWV